MNVTVKQAGDDGVGGEVDPVDVAAGNLDLTGRTDLADPLAFNDDPRRVDRLGASSVHEAARLDHREPRHPCPPLRPRRAAPASIASLWAKVGQLSLFVPVHLLTPGWPASD